MPTVDRSPLTRREIEIVVAWVKSGFVIASQEGEPWAARLLAKLRGAWMDASDIAEPERDPPPRDYQVPQHQTRPIDTPRELANDRVRASAGRTEGDRANFRGHGIRPGDPMPGDEQRCREHVAEIHARYDAGRAVMLAAARARDVVVAWGSLVHAHVVADGERIYALNDVDGSRMLLWDPDVDADPWAAAIDHQRADGGRAAAQGTPASEPGASEGAMRRQPPRERRKPPPRIGQ